mmetsp:Transcript_25025/g.99500  ORF Transcript_25025/g.99500 Transcript_25025/m.99500 type:complete len:573 (+) Transcript_25025:557-2275(+)
MNGDDHPWCGGDHKEREASRVFFWDVASARRVPAPKETDRTLYSFDAARFAGLASRLDRLSTTLRVQDAQGPAGDLTYGEIGDEAFARFAAAVAGGRRTFVDVGCGRGRSMCAAVCVSGVFDEILGLELREDLADVARRVRNDAADLLPTGVISWEVRVGDARRAGALADTGPSVLWLNWLAWSLETREAVVDALLQRSTDDVVLTAGYSLPRGPFELVATRAVAPEWTLDDDDPSSMCTLFAHVKKRTAPRELPLVVLRVGPPPPCDAERSTDIQSAASSSSGAPTVVVVVADGDVEGCLAENVVCFEETLRRTLCGALGDDNTNEDDETRRWSLRGVVPTALADRTDELVGGGVYGAAGVDVVVDLSVGRPDRRALDAYDAVLRPATGVLVVVARDRAYRAFRRVHSEARCRASGCSYFGGSRKRGLASQRLAACLTCSPDACFEVCAWCAAHCHPGHDLVYDDDDVEDDTTPDDGSSDRGDADGLLGSSAGRRSFCDCGFVGRPVCRDDRAAALDDTSSLDAWCAAGEWEEIAETGSSGLGLERRYLFHHSADLLDLAVVRSATMARYP